jgi:Photosystem II complex subunit Ycf12
MEFLSGFIGGVTSLNWEAIAQLTFVALIMLSGPVVIFVLAARGGDL